VAERYVRVGPVHFQTLEQELEPVARYLTGRFLNAGCGSRDIRSFLMKHGVTTVTRYDIASEDSEVVIGPLESMPFEQASFDSVLCNAVLEHVADPEAAMRELARVVRPGGHVVVAVPFLQPFHACPGDFQRYTADGLAELGRRAGLDVVTVLPVHSIGQTLGWILWEYALEKGGRLRRLLAMAAAYLLTRFRRRTDPQLVRNANTFQAVFRRPGGDNTTVEEDLVASGVWHRRSVPAACARVPTMLIPDELRLLSYLADADYTGAGAIIDAGCFLGGSTVALADGLRRNLRRRGRPAEKLIHSYDRFEVEDWTRGTYFPRSTPAGESFRPLFDRNIASCADLVEVHAGDVQAEGWSGGPIELLFIDVAKHWEVCDHVTWTFFPHLIPGRSVVIQQDYLYHHWVAWLHVTMEYYADYFRYVCDTGVNSVVFRYVRRIPDDVLRERTVASLTIAEKSDLMDRAAARFEGEQRRMLAAAKEHFLEMLRG
jgi:ubiquinone/menaquinone biosynthesis C-methylase UbiE